MSSKKRSLDLYLAEVFKQFISIKDDDFKKSQEVFKSVFEQVKQKMGDQCNYFKKYSSQVFLFYFSNLSWWLYLYKILFVKYQLHAHSF